MKIPLFRKAQEAQLLRICEERPEMIQKLEGLAEARLAEISSLKARLLDVDTARIQALDRLADARGRSKGATVPISIMVGFDVEPDHRVVELQNPSWRGAERIFEAFAELRSAMRLSGVEMPVTWFARADPQVKQANGHADWALRQFKDHWREAESLGDEIAIHMHPWRWNSHDKRWIQDFQDVSWTSECLDISGLLPVFRTPG